MQKNDRFGKEWSSNNTNQEFPTDQQAQQGLSFLGATPPSYGLHDAMFQTLDWKDNWLFDQVKGVTDAYGQTLDLTVSGTRTALADAISFAIDQARSNDQFAIYSSARTYTTGEIARGSDGKFYEFYDRDQVGTVQGVDPTDPANRPHVWMEWHGVRPGTVIEWRSETLPEGYVENDGATLSRSAYRRIFAAFGTTHGAGDGATTFGMPDDRGEFKRGWDHGRGVDAERSISAHQGDATALNGLYLTLQRSAGGTSTSMPYVNSGNNSLPFNANGSSSAYQIETSSTGIASNDTETRPRNNAVIYLTKI